MQLHMLYATKNGNMGSLKEPWQTRSQLNVFQWSKSNLILHLFVCFYNDGYGYSIKSCMSCRLDWRVRHKSRL